MNKTRSCSLFFVLFAALPLSPLGPIICGPLLFAVEELIHRRSGAKAETLQNAFLQGGWKPVRDPQEHFFLQVEGRIPDALHGGLFLRNGPSAQLDPAGRYHFFDGDGMVQSVHFQDGSSASSNAHVIETPRMLAEREAGRPLWVKVGDMCGFSGLIKLLLLEPLKDALRLRPKLHALASGQANTAFWSAAGRFFALYEASYPFELRLTRTAASSDPSARGLQLESVGYETFDDKLTHPMTAHPKVDQRTGETFFFGYSRRHGVRTRDS